MQRTPITFKETLKKSCIFNVISGEKLKAELEKAEHCKILNFTCNEALASLVEIKICSQCITNILSNSKISLEVKNEIKNGFCTICGEKLNKDMILEIGEQKLGVGKYFFDVKKPIEEGLVNSLISSEETVNKILISNNSLTESIKSKKLVLINL